MSVSTTAQIAMQARNAAWNMLIPKHAVFAEVLPAGGARYKHATKGWRKISAKRLAALGL